ncbi:beta-lactamase/transpeptidase-like protein [Agrocybe pediades]|nr:beta-lactamase/transpeptidase-like protein [Agrocybe pediades]
MRPIFLLALVAVSSAFTFQIPLLEDSSRARVDINLKPPPLISERTEEYIRTLLDRWNSTGLSVGVVRKEDASITGWRHEIHSYGIAQADGSSVTPDSVFAIASNSKLFLAISIGLLISNKTLAEKSGLELTWSTKVRDLIPEWRMMDEDMGRRVTLQDMLSHRTGLPRHDYAEAPFKGGISELISTMRYLRSSAEVRETFQYNNLIYEVLSYLPQVLVNQTFETYVSQHLFGPLNMTSSTFSVAQAEERGTMAHGFQRDMQDLANRKNGTLIPTVPYFIRPGEEKILAGAGGVLTSARDMVSWMTMLMIEGRHPITNKTIVPEEVIKHVTHGASVSKGVPEFPELSVEAYGAGQRRLSYQGHDVIEHGGSLPGYKSQISRFPDDNLGIIVMSNDANAGFLVKAVKFRIAEELLGLKEVNWNARFEQQYRESIEAKAKRIIRRPALPELPSQPFSSLAVATFVHTTYGSLKPCLVPETASGAKHALGNIPHEHCEGLLKSKTVQRILGASDLSVPTFIIPFKRTMSTHLRLSHFSGNLFNVTVLWSNAEVREREGYSRNGVGDDLLTGFDDRFEVEWVHGEDSEEGLAFKGDFWGQEGSDARSSGGLGKDSAEVWFAKV